MAEKRDVPDTALLRRRIQARYLKPDGTISSAAFKSGRELSVDWCELRTRAETAECEPGCGIAEFKAGVPRERGLAVEHDPCPDYDALNAAHTLVIGNMNGSRVKHILKSLELLVRPGEPIPDD